MKNKYTLKESAVVVSCVAVYLLVMTLAIYFTKAV
jgi:hypothetical protein